MQWFRINAMNVVGCLIWCNFDHYWWRYMRNIRQFESVAHNEPKQWPRVNANNPVGSSLVLVVYNCVLNWYRSMPIYGQFYSICRVPDHISIYITMLECWNGNSAQHKVTLALLHDNMHSGVQRTGVWFRETLASYRVFSILLLRVLVQFSVVIKQVVSKSTNNVRVYDYTTKCELTSL